MGALGTGNTLVIHVATPMPELHPAEACLTDATLVAHVWSTDMIPSPSCACSDRLLAAHPAASTDALACTAEVMKDACEKPPADNGIS